MAQESDLGEDEVLSWVTPILSEMATDSADFFAEHGDVDTQRHRIAKYARAMALATPTTGGTGDGS